MRIARWVLVVMVVGLAIRASLIAWDVSVRSDRLPEWDRAAHGLHGLKMAAAIRQGDLAELGLLIHRRDAWPPLFPLLEAPVFLLFGEDFEVPERAMVVPYLACVLLIFGVGLAMGGTRGAVTGAVAAALIAASPYFQVYGGFQMLEMMGVFWTLLAMIFYVRFCRTGMARDAHLMAIATGLLFFHKYNYTVLWLIPLVLSEIGRSLPTPREAVAWVVRTVPGQARRPFGMFVIAYLLGLVAIVLTGGWAGQVAGVSVRLDGLRDPLLLLMAVFAARALLRPRYNVAWVRNWIAGLQQPLRSMVLFAAIPAMLWLAVPSHARAFLEFLKGFDDPQPTFWHHFIFYPDVFIHGFTPPVWLGLAVFAGALFSVRWIRRVPAGARIIPVAVATYVLLTTLHSYKVPRFYFTVAPVLWLGFGLTVAMAIEAFAGQAVKRTVAFTVSIAAIAVSLVFGLQVRAAESLLVRSTAPPEAREVLDTIAGVNVDSRGTVMFGFWNKLSPMLVEWKQRLVHPEPSFSPRPKNPMWYEEDDPGRLLDAIAADPEVERVIVVLLEPGDPAYDSHYDRDNPAIGLLHTALRADARFQLENSRVFPATGYEFFVYAKRPPGTHP